MMWEGVYIFASETRNSPQLNTIFEIKNIKTNTNLLTI